jgi:lipopolysaccharide/colanic/teichoic acid biosynthesis glycosyltransferase/glycosyltransferase involved in cell wall biosynthesis
VTSVHPRTQHNPVLKVLHIGKFYPPVAGGMERVVQSLCNVTKGRLDSSVLAFNTGAETSSEIVDGIPVTRVGTWGSAGSVAVSPAFPLHLRQAQADVLILHEPNPWALLSFATVRPRVPLAIWFHSEVVRPRLQYDLFYAPIARPAYRQAARFLVSSRALADHAAVLQPFSDRVTVIPFGIDVDSWRPTEMIQQRAEQIRSESPHPIVLFAGRHVAYKGLQILIEAAAPLAVSVILLGDGPMRSAWTDLAAKQHGPARFTFRGEVGDEEMRAYLLASRMFVLPSVTRAEAFGFVQLEAMASGTPVISTRLETGVPWVNQTGTIVPPHDVLALREAIARLAAEPGLAAALGAAGQARARSEFSLQTMGDRLVDVCEELAARGGSPAAFDGRCIPWRRCSSFKYSRYSQSSRLAIGAPRLSRCDAGLPPRAAGSVMKRAFDVSLAGAGLLFSSPLWVLFGAAIKLEDGGPIFYTQERVGLRGCVFNALKFRSMRPDAEAGVGAIQAMEHDPRVTRVGRLMRATAMDELPQLWNIVRGDMSFVGPRALRPGEVETSTGREIVRIDQVPGYAARIGVRPGLTGIAQIYAPRDVARRQKFRYDRLYVRRQSLWLDARLILLSFWISFRGTWESRGRKY